VADDPRAVIVDQVRNGVAVRMAVLFRLLGSTARAGRDAAVALGAASDADDPGGPDVARRGDAVEVSGG
jgi:hypothetical protein